MNRVATKDVEKMEACLLYVLEKGGSMETMKLAKILYLADYLYAKTFGRTDSFMGGHERKNWGPVPKQFYPAFHDLESKGIVTKNKDTHVISAIAPHKTSELSEEEMACLDKTLDEFGGYSIGRVKKAAYKTEPMIEIQAQEKAAGGAKFMDEEMDFSTINRHPLFDADDIDLSFLDDPEFKKTLE